MYNDLINDERKDTAMTTTLADRKLEVKIAIDDLLDFMNTAAAERVDRVVLYADGGRKYIRIVMDWCGQRSVHCFIDANTGDVYKAATWKAPALNGARYNLLDAVSLAELKDRWDWAGSYLYKR